MLCIRRTWLLALPLVAVLAASCSSSQRQAQTLAAPTTTANAPTSVPSSAASPTGNSPSTTPTTPAASPTTPIATTRAYAPPVPVRTTRAPQPTHTTAQAQTCYPLTNGGKCYTPGEYCRAGDHGASGIDAAGDAIKCDDNNGWRWERV
jgi:hypothetical protein